MSDKGSISDGYYTFDELYEHRHRLFIALMRCNPELAWRANNHHDGEGYEGWFIAGMDLPTGQVSSHLPARLWESLDGVGIRTTNRAPKWDGHTSDDVLERLAAWCI